MQAVLKYSDAFWPNFYALSYAIVGYIGGIIAILSHSLLVNLLGVAILSHAMVIAAYLIHECAHNTIFKKAVFNNYLGEILGWITGSCYGAYKIIQHKHFRHHADKADVVAFDYRLRLEKHRFWVKLIKTLEWAYIPAVEIIMHALVLVLPFTMASRKQNRARVIVVAMIRIPLFMLLASISIRFIFLYPFAYMIFLTVMRFMDTHQHTYEIFETLEQARGEEAKRFNRDYEHRNTFSNLISIRYPFLNLLVLNFGYHNAHHVKVGVPWYRLPQLHRELFGEDKSQLFDFGNLIKSFHKYRVARVLNADIGDIDINESKGTGFIGVNGVSFLTAH